MFSGKRIFSKVLNFGNLKKNFFKTSFFSATATLYLFKTYGTKSFAVNEIPVVTANEKVTYFEEVDPDKVMSLFPNLTVLKSNAVQNLMGLIRDKNISREQFRLYSRRIIRFIIEETLALEADHDTLKESPLGVYKTKVSRRNDDDYVAISILRSGNSMVEELLVIMPGINVGNILVQRDETTKEKHAIFYFEKLPDDLADKKILLLDPMLATGGSATASIEILKNKGVLEENILFLNFVSCVEGLDNMFKKYPKMKIITSKVDPYLLPNKYIAPGLGDFGDRYYGTLKKTE